MTSFSFSAETSASSSSILVGTLGCEWPLAKVWSVVLFELFDKVGFGSTTCGFPTCMDFETIERFVAANLDCFFAVLVRIGEADNFGCNECSECFVSCTDVFMLSIVFGVAAGALGTPTLGIGGDCGTLALRTGGAGWTFGIGSAGGDWFVGAAGGCRTWTLGADCASGASTLSASGALAKVTMGAACAFGAVALAAVFIERMASGMSSPKKLPMEFVSASAAASLATMADSAPTTPAALPVAKTLLTPEPA